MSSSASLLEQIPALDKNLFNLMVLSFARLLEFENVRLIETFFPNIQTRSFNTDQKLAVVALK